MSQRPDGRPVKYIFVTGGVVSSLGKGLAAASIGRLLEDHGYKVALTGEGADEWLAGYPWFKYARMTKFLDVIPGLGYRARRLFLRATGQPVYPAHMVAELQKYLGGQNGWMDVYGMMSLNKLRFFTPELREKRQRWRM